MREHGLHMTLCLASRPISRLYPYNVLPRIASTEEDKERWSDGSSMTIQVLTLPFVLLNDTVGLSRGSLQRYAGSILP